MEARIDTQKADQPMIYIIIPVFNRLNFTVDCLRSLQRQQYRRFKIIVVNDGSTDNTAPYLKEHFPDVIVLEGNGNLWWTGATNYGVHKALGLHTDEQGFILTLNNDLVVKEDYLDQLLHTAKLHPHALIGSVSVHIDQPDEVHFAGTKWNARTAKYRPSLHEKISYWQLIKKFDTIETDLLPGRGVLIPVSLFEKIGLYDDTTFPHYMADEDFSLRAKALQYKLLVAAKAVVYNHVAETGLKRKVKNWRYYKDVFTSIKSPVNFHNRWNWAKKHAGIPAPVYFVFDMMRIFKGLMFKS